MHLILIAIGGALGALLRYLFSLIFSKYLCTSFPCGTLFVNVVGSFLITLFMFVFNIGAIDPMFRYFFVIGFLGSFTTLSSITYDTLSLIKEGNFFYAIINLFSNFFISLVAGICGFFVARILFFREG